MTQTSKGKQSTSKGVKPFFDNLPKGVKAFLLTSITWTALPLFVAIWDGSDDPFMFTAAFGFGETIFGVLYLFAFHRELLKWEKVKSFLPTRKTLFKKLQEPKNNDPPRWNWVIILTLPKATLALYAWSTAYIPDLVAAVLRDLLGFPLMLLFMLLFKNLFVGRQPSKSSLEDSKPNDKNSNSRARKIALIFFIIFGVILVILSGNSGAAKNLSPFNRETLIGLILIVFAVANSNMGRPIYRWSGLLSDSKESENTPDITKELTKNMNEAYFIFIASLSTLITGIIGLVITSFTSNSIGWTNFWIVLGVGAVFSFLGSKANVLKNLSKTHDKAGIISLTPVITVIYLWLFSYIDNVRLDIFVLGLCAIVIGNMLLRLTSKVKI